MPSWPGVLPLMEHAHAGTVIGGVMEARSPCIPLSMSLRMFGISSRRSPNTSFAGAQSSPITATRGASVMPPPSAYSGQASRKGARRRTSLGSGSASLYRKAIRATELQECAPMGSLRKVLFLHAAVWAVLGAILVIAPGPLVDALHTYVFVFAGNEGSLLTD